MMLPSVPKSIGRLSEVFIAVMQSLSGDENSLRLARARSSCVILVDGLGSANLSFRPGHAPRLNHQLVKDGSITTGFPTTTATSLTSLATGTLGGTHGIIGYEVYDRETNKPLNLLTGITPELIAAKYQSQPTVSELASDQGVQIHFVGSPEYENSAFTQITMPKATFHAGRTVEDRFEIAKQLLQKQRGALVYLYIPELDSKAHAKGANSLEWLELLELLESEVIAFKEDLSGDVGVLLTADHGVIDVPYSGHIYLDEFEIGPKLQNVSGDPRVNFLFFENTPDIELVTRLRSWLQNRAYVATREEMIASGWYGLVVESTAERMPDIFIIAKGKTAIYHRGFVKPHSLKMIGQHGGMDSEELTVPLLRFGAYQK